MSEKIYGLLLRLYPRRFRDRYGREMRQLFRERFAVEPRFRLWLEVLADLAVSVPGEHWRPTEAFRVSPTMEAIKGGIKIILGTAAMCEVALWGGASEAWVTVIFLLSVEVAFVTLLHGWRTPAWEYSLGAEGIEIRGGFAKPAQIRASEITRIVQTRDGLVVFGSSGAQIPVYSFVSGYPAIRERLSGWSPIEVLPSRGVPGGILALGCLAALLMTNPWAVLAMGLAAGGAILYNTLHPAPHPQLAPAKGWKRWAAPVLAVTVLGIKVFSVMSSL